MKKNKLILMLCLVFTILTNCIVLATEKNEIVEEPYTLVIDYKFNSVGAFSEGLAYVELDNQKGYINRKGEFILDISKFEKGGQFQDGMAKVSQNGKYGFINIKGELVVPCTFDKVYDYSMGYAIVSNNNLYGIIDTKGKYIAAIQYQFATPFDKQGEALVKENDEYKLINTNGEVVITYPYTVVYPFSDGYASFLGDLGYGYMDKQGNIIIEPKYDAAMFFKDGLGSVFTYPYWEYVNEKGEVVANNFDSVDTFSEGMAKIQRFGAMGFLNMEGEIAFYVNDYKYSKPFSEGLSAVKSGDFGGFINKSGELVIPYDFQEVDDFSNGYAPVFNGVKWGFISSSYSSPYYEDDYYEEIDLKSTDSGTLYLVFVFGIPVVLAFIAALILTKIDKKRADKK